MRQALPAALGCPPASHLPPAPLPTPPPSCPIPFPPPIIQATPYTSTAHLGPHCEPVAAAHVGVDGVPHMVRHVVLPHLHNALQRILRAGWCGVVWCVWGWVGGWGGSGLASVAGFEGGRAVGAWRAVAAGRRQARGGWQLARVGKESGGAERAPSPRLPAVRPTLPPSLLKPTPAAAPCRPWPPRAAAAPPAAGRRRCRRGGTGCGSQWAAPRAASAGWVLRCCCCCCCCCCVVVCVWGGV